MAFGMDSRDRRLDPGPVVGVLHPPARRGGVGLDHHPLAFGTARLLDRGAAAVDRPGRGRDPEGGDSHLGEVLVVGHSPQDRARSEEGEAVPGAQQGQHHLAVEEAAPVEQWKDEVGLGLLEQSLISVGQLEVEPQALQYLAHLDMVQSVVAVLRVEPALPQSMLGDEHDPQPLLGFWRDSERADV